LIGSIHSTFDCAATDLTSLDLQEYYTFSSIQTKIAADVATDPLQSLMPLEILKLTENTFHASLYDF
jgi:hypothetical protein